MVGHARTSPWQFRKADFQMGHLLELAFKPSPATDKAFCASDSFLKSDTYRRLVRGTFGAHGRHASTPKRMKDIESMGEKLKWGDRTSTAPNKRLLSPCFFGPREAQGGGHATAGPEPWVWDRPDPSPVRAAQNLLCRSDPQPLRAATVHCAGSPLRHRFRQTIRHTRRHPQRAIGSTERTAETVLQPPPPGARRMVLSGCAFHSGSVAGVRARPSHHSRSGPSALGSYFLHKPGTLPGLCPI
jgi:hypothetical protein